ncbi:hypothetical protein OED52_17880 [Rhodococcus sp. Z13]|uniref:Uncharacterized protein n=1 Tax=Rhodococcus sacchari TaxID=2962047 RepID=A0ACD4DEN4_9NOCA|nr:hypothetical protein [Rhodococcus sp. Z13]UYP18501.1 hypothetical protein OED52_17880 [Rhodococcus sp. Z13]
MERPPESTCDDVGRVARSRSVAFLRAAATVALLIVVLAGGLGLLGVRSAEMSAAGGGYELELTYPRIARPGLDVPWSVTVSRPGGFDGEIVLALDTSYFEILEMRGRLPEPASETAGDGLVYMTFDPPPGEEFTFSLDVRIRAGKQWGESGSVSLMDGETAAATIYFDTWVVP